MGYFVSEVSGRRISEYLNSAQRAVEDAERAAEEARVKRAAQQEAHHRVEMGQQDVIYFQQELMRDLWATRHDKWDDHQQKLYADIAEAYRKFRGAKND